MHHKAEDGNENIVLQERSYNIALTVLDKLIWDSVIDKIVLKENEFYKGGSTVTCLVCLLILFFFLGYKIQTSLFNELSKRKSK